MTKTYNAIIIGTGQAGFFLAQRLTGAGRKVAIVECILFGGMCINTGCTPTKTMIASASARTCGLDGGRSPQKRPPRADWPAADDQGRSGSREG